MRVVAKVDVLGDEGQQRGIARLSLALLGACLAAAVALAALVPAARPRVVWAFVLALVLGYLVSLPVHELVHGAAFKLLGGAGTHVVFGAAQGMLYASCPGVRFGRRSFYAILLAPFVVLSSAYLAIGLAAGAPLLAWCLFGLHASGCAGDFWLARAIVANPRADLCEDTKTGILLLASEGAAR